MTKETFNLDLDGFERYASVQIILVDIKATANKRFHFKRYETYLYTMETELIKTTEYRGMDPTKHTCKLCSRLVIGTGHE